VTFSCGKLQSELEMWMQLM